MDSTSRDVRRRILRAYVLAAFAVGPCYISFFILFGAWWAIGGPAIFTIMTVAAFFLSRADRIDAAALSLISGLWLGPVASILATGGLDSPIIIWLTPTPFMAGALLGRRGAIVAGSASVAAVVIVALLPEDPFPRELVDGRNHHILSALCGMTAVALLTFYGWATTKNFEEAQARVQAEHAAVVRASDELSRTNAAMSAVLEQVDQGLTLVAADGTVLPGRSKALERWFGEPREGARLWDYAAPHNPNLAKVLELAWDDLHAGFMPGDVVLGQVPERFVVADRHFALRCRQIEDTDTSHVLIVVSDISEQVEAETRDRSNRDLLALFEHQLRDSGTFATTFEEYEQILARARAPIDADTFARDLHTLKGNAAMLGMNAIAELVHHIEGDLAQEGYPLAPTAWAEFDAVWANVHVRASEWARAGSGSVTIRRELLRTLVEDLDRSPTSSALARRVEQWTWESVHGRLESLATLARRTARVLGKPELVIDMEGAQTVVPPRAEVAPLWSVLCHIVRNAVDHGIEGPDARRAAGKPEGGHLQLGVESRPSALVVRIQDDGAGIDWERVAKKAQSLGIPAKTEEDLVAALFSDGFSTSATVTSVSGRGVGLGAVRDAVTARGGEFRVKSNRGRGTLFEVDYPLAMA